MSIWICNARNPCQVLCWLALLVVTGCETTGIGFPGNGPEKVVVAGKSVVIAGPPGYCVDSTATRNSASGAFVLLGSCASISNNAQVPVLGTPGLLTASVSGAGGSAISASLDQLEAFFASDAGRAALARDGRAASVKILATRRRGKSFYVHARDTSGSTKGGISQDYWRGLFDVRGRIVTVSVVGFERKPMSNALGLATLDAFATRIRTENAIENGLTPAGLNGRLPQ